MNGRVADSRGGDEGSPGGAVTGTPGAAAVVAGDASDVAERRQRFEREAMAHLDALYAFALKLSRSRDDAEDLVGDTILYHVFVSRKRRIDAREVHAPDDSEGWSAFEAVGEIDPEGKFYDSFLDDEVTRAIESLPEEYRSAVVLSDLHELRYAEIAEILGVPEGTVKSRLFRGRRLLQKKLVDYAV